MNKAFITLAFVMTVSICIGCNSVSPKNTAGILKTVPVVTHEIKYSNKGSKSEGKSGYMKINDYLLPDVFIYVVADGKVFNFMQKNNKWGNDGYFPLENESIELFYPAVNNIISESDIKKGWCEIKGRCINTPEHWIFVQWDTGSAAVSPDVLRDLIKNKSLKTIPRNTMLSEKRFK